MTYHARIGEDGRVAVPSELTDALGLKPGDAVSIERQGESLVLLREEEPVDAADRLRRVLRGYSVAAFLSERAADWAE